MPLVALESTVIAHGLPYPQNVETALHLEAVVRRHGAEPRTLGLIEGRPVAGLTEAQIRRLATGDAVRKISLRDLPIAVARRLDGATTVAATLWIAEQHGIGVFATGGIGGVHRALHGVSYDVSTDLEMLGRTGCVVVCAGAKAILDLPATREVLETKGVTVVGYGADTLPAFYTRSSGLPVDVRCDTPEEVADLVRARRELRLPGATLVTVPVPEEAALAETVKYCKERTAFGQPIGTFQNSRFRLAEMQTEITIGRSFADQCILELNAGTLTPEKAAMAKYWLSDLQGRVIDQCVQLHGGYGYMMEYPIAKMYTDARASRIYGGTNEIMKEIIGRSMGF